MVDKVGAMHGPTLFMNRMRTVACFPKSVRVCTPSLGDIALVRKDKKKLIVARLDGVYYYQLSGPSIFGILRQRQSSVVPFVSWLTCLPSLPDILSVAFNHHLNRGVRWLLKNADAIVFQSELSRRMHLTFLGYNPKRVPETIIFNGVDLSEFTPKLGSKLEGMPAVIISASIYRLHKRLQDGIRLVNFLSREFPNIRLHVLGDFDPLVRDVLKSLDTSRCIFHGGITPALLPAFYAGADIQLSLTIFDACPNVVCEGLASGLPVVTPIESGAAELVGEKNRRWCVEEGLAFEYRSLHVASCIPHAPLERYALVVKEIIYDLRMQKQHARARAEEVLNIQSVARQYEQFITQYLQ